MTIDQSISQIAMMMDLSEAEVREAFDNLIKPQSYVPIQDFCKSAKCSEYDAIIRKRIRKFYRKKVRNKE